MPTLLDTNVYLFAMRSEEGAAFFESRFLPLVFQTYLAGVVVADGRQARYRLKYSRETQQLLEALTKFIDTSSAFQR